MKIIEIDAATWSDGWAIFDALAEALGAVPGHGRNLAAFVDSVFYGGMLAIEPPFKVVIQNCPDIARGSVEVMAEDWTEAREWKRVNYGEDVNASIVLG